MKYSILLLSLFFVIACNNTKKEVIPQNSELIEETSEHSKDLTYTNPEGFNTLVNDTIDDGMMYLGRINRTGLERDFGEAWFHENFKAHTVDSTNIKELTSLLPETDIKVFMGTWCEDSQREVPALLKILDLAAYDVDEIEMIAVTHDKDTPQGLEANLNIEYVPTIIFYKDGVEQNRIVEYAQESLEKDMTIILKGEPYKHAYQD